jgi:hypothetical protein
MQKKLKMDDDAVNEALEDTRVRSAFIGHFRSTEAYRVACSMPQGLSDRAQFSWLIAQPQILEWLREVIHDAKEQECAR